MATVGSQPFLVRPSSFYHVYLVRTIQYFVNCNVYAAIVRADTTTDRTKHTLLVH